MFLGQVAGGKFEAAGTAFFLMHDNMPYLVTARHVAEQLGDDPFWFRVNSMEGDALNCHADPHEWAEHEIQWFFHGDSNIDVAALPFGINLNKAGADYVVLSTAEIINPAAIDTGDICSVIGLFSLHQGAGRITPIVHTGNIAMMPDPQEPIPTEGFGRKWEIEGYLVEISNLQGLSGSPVMVRPTVALQVNKDGTQHITAGAGRVYLLGVWQGSWEGQSGIGGVRQARVPVGMGIVTPIEKLIEILDSPSCVANRQRWAGVFRAVIDA
jgi:hypothetical protein